MRRYFNLPNIGLLIFRVFVGLSMAFGHGLGKIPPSDKLIGGVSGMGFPLPEAFAWLAALSELGGGLFIAVGLFTRHAAFFLGFTMFVAGFVVHASDPFNVKELAFMYLASCVLLLFVGPGKFSVDRLFNRD